MIEEFIVN